MVRTFWCTNHPYSRLCTMWYLPCPNTTTQQQMWLALKPREIWVCLFRLFLCLWTSAHQNSLILFQHKHVGGRERERGMEVEREREREKEREIGREWWTEWGGGVGRDGEGDERKRWKGRETVVEMEREMSSEWREKESGAISLAKVNKPWTSCIWTDCSKTLSFLN